MDHIFTQGLHSTTIHARGVWQTQFKDWRSSIVPYCDTVQQE